MLQNLIIIGAGIGGLTLANAVQKKNQKIRIQIFERDSDQRPQGYTLNLKTSGGLIALEKLGLLEELQNQGEPRTQLVFLTSGGNMLMKIPTSLDQQPPLRIRRSALRDALLRGLDPKLIQFKTKVISYSHEHGKPFILLENGKKEYADLIVACDGVHSVIRQQMIGDPLCYLGVSAIGATAVVPPVDHFLWQHPFLKKPGDHVFYLDEGKAMFCFREENSFVWQFTQSIAENAWSHLSRVEWKKQVLENTSLWTKEAYELVRLSKEENLVMRGYYDREPSKKIYDGKIVLLGDAAHPMSPMEGQGGNMAMADAIELAELLTSCEKPFDLMVADYQKQVFTRANKWQKKSRQQIANLHKTGKIAKNLRNIGFWIAGRALAVKELFSSSMVFFQRVQGILKPE